MYCNDRLVIMDADGTTIDAFDAITETFEAHDMSIGEFVRFQKRRNIFKYLGGIKELPKNLRKQLNTEKRVAVLDTLTQVYRQSARLYEGMDELLNQLIDHAGIRVGVVTRNITLEPEVTLQQLYRRNGVNVSGLDFVVHLPQKEQKLNAFKAVRESFKINPARAYACGDEKRDYVAAIGTGMHPFMVSYGFESYERLTDKIGVPAELISRQPLDLKRRILHALDLLQAHQS
ncbi:MAG: HAD hydrolase-like protein [Candidatus Thiodiazotropha lotti]|uniref:phosphoglycolate phosphatase n=1 Tax=Candidatus Thiodiazotropha lotti TaxID=2792787 RepID=A0A9E4MZ47_9GAMM|nr:HAD hydrolase-like protein [Candidatus Thiodiazotropha lotti]ODC00127.1 haloacid dehalogenase [Candidatus Thiodiazotropha endoloripes]MCG7922232.1 HAD hydrolase-like protein [Candidatus Thiodiazotropha lotti]MCG7931743.1 HAD hydrolase-like protein [Candidatus Thiodiazotropha lotti]MCG7939122.1 HAD hydrolase-like protein [Candidatus Thiodiazotropha lotti]